MEDLIDLISEPALLVDAKGNIRTMNPPGLQMFEYDNKEELVDRPVEALIPTKLRITHEKHVQKYITEPHKKGFKQLEGVFGITKNGNKLELDVTLVPIPMHNAMFVAAVLTDLGKTRELAQKLERSLEKLLTL